MCKRHAQGFNLPVDPQENKTPKKPIFLTNLNLPPDEAHVCLKELPMQKRPEDDFSTDFVIFFSSAIVASHNKQISFLK